MESLNKVKTDSVILLSGLLRHKSKIKIPDRFIEFDTHIKPGKNSMWTEIETLKHYFYPQFVDNLLPKIDKGFFSKKVRSYTTEINQDYIYTANGKEFVIPVKYLDLFLFANSTLIFSIKMDLGQLPLGLIPQFNHKIRHFNFEPGCIFQDIFFELNNLSSSPKKELNNYPDFLHLIERGNKLKSFILLAENFEYPIDYNRDFLLFDLATCTNIGTSIGKSSQSSFQSSLDYYNIVMKENKISVFENWTALSLLDSFVLIQNDEGQGLSRLLHQWEHLTFRFIYINAFFVKNYLSEINTEFRKEKYSKDLTDIFLLFDKTHILDKISYNFLPNIIYRKVNKGFEIDSELKQMHYTIEKERAKKDVQKNNRLKVILFVLSIFSLLSAFKDWSDLLLGFGFSNNNKLIFNLAAIAPTLFIVLFITFLWYWNKRKSK